MVKVILLLVYLWQATPTAAPELVVYRQSFDSPEACQEAGKRRMEVIQESEKFAAGVFAGCIAAQVQEASK